MLFGGGSTGGIGTGIVFSLYDNFNKNATKIGSGWIKLEGQTSKSTRKMQGYMTSIQRSMKNMLIGGIMLAPILMGVGKSMEFNASMSEVFAKSGTTNIEVQKQLTAEAIRLGEATKFSAKEAAEGQTFLAMAGFKTSEIMSAMPGVLSLAAAGNIELADSANIASNILTSMGLEASEMGRVADVLALGASSANVDVKMLGETFAYAAASANTLGWSLEQTTAMAGLLGNIGIQGSSAGTAIQNFNLFLSRLDDKKLAQIGMTMSDIQDSSGNMKDVPTVFATIMDNIKGLGNVDASRILSDLFGVRGQKSVAAFKSAMGSDLNFKSFVGKLKNSAGSAEKIAKEMLNNLKGDLTILGSVWETTLIKIGNSTESGLRPLVRGLTKVVQAIGNFIQSDIGKWTIRIIGILGGLIVAINAISIAVNFLKMAALKSVGAATAFIAAWWPVILIAALIGGAIWLVNKSIGSFKEIMDGTAAPAKGFLGLMQKLGGVFMAIGEIWSSASKDGFTMSEGLSRALEKLGLYEFAISLGTWIVRIKLFFKGVGEGIKVMWSKVKVVLGYIRFSKIGDVFEKFGFNMDRNKSQVAGWIETGKIVAYVIGVILVAAFTAWAISVIAATWPIILIIGLIVGLIYLIKNWGSIMDWFAEKWAAAWKYFSDSIISEWESIKEFGEKFYDFGVSIVDSIKEGISSAWESLKIWMSGMLTELLAPMKDILINIGLVDEEMQNNVKVGDGSNDVDGTGLSQLALVNAKQKATGFVVPEPVVITTNNVTEILKDVKINMDGRQIRSEIDKGSSEDLDRQ